MALFSAGRRLPYETRSRGDGSHADYAESQSACSAGDGFLSSFFPNCGTSFYEPAGRQPTAGEATADVKEQGTSVAVPDSSCVSSASPSQPPPPPSASCRYYLQPLPTGTGGRAASFGDTVAAAPSPYAAASQPLWRHPLYRSGDASAAFTESPLDGMSATQAKPTMSGACSGADRRLQTQRPLYRAHPYGSSLLGRLVNKIATSFSSLSSFVPRMSVGSPKAQKNAETASAAAAHGASSESHEEATQHKLLHAPLENPLYGNTLRWHGVNAYPVRKLAAGGPVQVTPPTTNAAGPAVCGRGIAGSGAMGNRDMQATRDGAAPDFGGELYWPSDRQQSLPYGQMRPAAAGAQYRGASPVFKDPGRFLSEQAPYSSFEYNLQQPLRRQQQLRQQQLLQQMQQQQQQVRRLQMQVAGSEGLPGGTDIDADAGESSRQVRLTGSAAAEFGQNGLAYMSLEGDAVQRGTAAGEETGGERRGAAAVGSTTQLYSFPEVPRQRILGKSCFDSVAAGGVGIDADTGTYGNASLAHGSVLLQQKQRQHTGLSQGRDLGGARRAAEIQPAEDMVFYEDEGVLLGAPAPGRFGNGGPLLSRNASSTVLTQQEERLEREVRPSSRQVLRESSGGASFLPDVPRQQQGMRAGRRIQSSGLQEETISGVSLSRTSSNSGLFTTAEEGFSKPRRQLQRRSGGASSLLFSHALAPAWLSSASADLLDAEAGTTAATGEAGATGAGHPSRRAAKPSPRSSTGTGVGTRKAARGNTSGTLLYPRQEQLTVEQLQKLYLRCQPLRWRVRLRDLLRQEALEAAAAERQPGLKFAEREPVGAASPGDGKHDGAVAPGFLVGGKEGQTVSVDSSNQTKPAREEGIQREGGGSAAEKAAQRTQQERAATTQRGASPEEQEKTAAAGGQTGSRDGSPPGRSSVAGGTVLQTSRAGEEEEKQPSQVPKVFRPVTGEGSSAAGGFGTYEQGNKGDTTGGNTEGTPAVSFSGVASRGIDTADGSKRSKLGSEAAPTDGGVGVVRGLFGSGSSGAGGAGAPTSSLFGSSSSSLFGVSRTAPVAGGLDGQKLELGRVAEGQSGSAVASAGEKPTLSLFGQSSVSVKSGGPSSMPTPLFGSSSSSSLFEGVAATAAAHQQQQQDGRDSTSEKTGPTPTSLFGGTAPSSRLFGGTRDSSSPQHPPQQLVGAEQATATSQPPAYQQAEKEQPVSKETATGSSTTQGHESKDAAAAGKPTAMTAAGGAGGTASEKPAEDSNALPWWQQNLNKPCSVMPEEDFAPEAGDEEESEEEKTKVAEKELPPLKMPNIFASSSGSGGLFGSAGAGTSSLSLFTTAPPPSFPPASTTPAAPTAASTGAATGAPPLFGSASTGAGLWNQNSGSSSLFGGLKPSAAGSAAAVPPGSLFGGHDSSKQPSLQLPGAKSDVPAGTSSGSSATPGEKQPPSLFGNLTASSTTFPTQKSSASLFGGSIFGNPVATSQSTSTSHPAAGASAAPATGTGLFVFGASSGSSAPPPAATTPAPSGHPQPVSSGPTAVTSIFGSSQQPQQGSSGTGKRGRDVADGGDAAAAPAAKSLFGAAPAPTPAAAGGGLGLFGQRLPAGGSTLFGGGTSGGGGLFSTGSTAGQTESNTAGKTGVGGGGIFGDRDNSSGVPGSIFGAPRSVTPVFGSNSSSASKESVGSSTSTAAAGGGSAAPGASASTGSSSGLFGSSSNNNPFGFGGGTGATGVSLFGGSTSTPADSSRSATAESGFSAVQPLWSAGKAGPPSTTTQGLFSLPSSSSAAAGAAAGRMGAGAAAGGASNGMLESSRSLFGASAGGNASTPGSLGVRSATGVQGGLNSVPSSIFGNASGTAAFTFGAAPASTPAQQQQQQPSSTPGAPAASAPAAGGADAGSGGNPFFGALPSGVRRPRLTIKRSKQ